MTPGPHRHPSGMIDYRRYHDLTERLAAFSAHGGQHLRGDREDLQVADGEPVYSGEEQERARIVGPLAISGPRSIGDRDGASFGLVLEGPATVVLTTERLIVMAFDGASQLGPVAAAEVHTFVLPWDLVDAVSMPAKKTLGDRVAGGRTIQLAATGLIANVSVAPLKKVLIHDEERRLSDDEVMSLIVRTAVEHRLSVSPANDHQRLRAMSEGRYQFEGGERVAYITDPDETDVPAHLVGRLVDDETSAAGLQPGEPLPPPPAAEDELAPEVVLPPMPVVAPRFEGMLDGRPVLVAFDQERALLSIDDADADRPTVSIPIDDRTVAFEIDESIVRSGRWLVSFEPDQRHAARQLVDSVNSVISGRERIVKDVDATDAHGREVRLSVDWTDRPPTVLVVAPSTGGMTRFDVPPASKCVLEGGRLELGGRVFHVADSDSATRFLDELTGGPRSAETSAPQSVPSRRVERTMSGDRGLEPVASGASSARGGPQYVGSAPVGNVWTIRHFVDAACYVIFGITLFVIGAGWGILFGILAILYGVKIAALGGPYWVSSLVYVVVFIAVLYALGSA